MLTTVYIGLMPTTPKAGVQPPKTRFRRRGFAEIARAGTSNQAIDYKKAVLTWQEKGDASGFHALLDEPNGPLRGMGRATLLKVTAAMGDRDFAKAEHILSTDPKQEFDLGDRRFICRDFLLGWIKKSCRRQRCCKNCFRECASAPASLSPKMAG
jgi:hypothetical protein